jgi:formylglycine-generating enzyme required for sulfatase activity
METKNILRIVLSSPGDVLDERNIMERVVDELNHGIADDRHLHLELKRWETEAYPDVHPDGPQGVIDAVLNISACDILIGIFWKRFGTPVKAAGSGTEHEIRAALQSCQTTGRPRLMLYFKEAERPLTTAEEHEQYARVLRFREEYSHQGLYWTFPDTPDFERLVRLHLTQQIRHHFSPAPAEAQPLPPKQREQNLARRYCQNLQQKFSTIHLFGEKHGATPLDKTVRSRQSYSMALSNGATPSAAGNRSAWRAVCDMADIVQGFVPLHLQEWRDDEIPLDKILRDESQPAPALDLESLFFDPAMAGPRQFLLRGLPGSGKTTLLRYLTYRFAGLGATGDQSYLPVYLRCKSLDLTAMTLEENIRVQIDQDCDSKEMHDALCAHEQYLEKQTVLLFDGVDEIEHAETAQKFPVELVKLAKLHPRCKIIVTSRPIGLRPADWPGFRRYDVLPLAPEMIDAYLEKWFAGAKGKIAALRQTFADKPRIRALAENPFLLSMICYTYEQSGDTALIERRSELYKNCTKYLIRRLYDPESAVQINENDSLAILKDLSLRFFLWQEADFPVDHVNVMGKRVLTAEVLGKTEDFLNRVQRDTGLLQRDKEGFAFVHRSLWEYFTALALLDKKSDFVIRHAANPDWEEVVRLYAGLLQKQEAVTALVNGLWNINRPLALRVTTEVQTPAVELLKPLIEKEEGNQAKLLLIDGLAQSLPLISERERKNLVQETLAILLLACAERDCEVIYHAQELLEKVGLQPLQPGGLIYQLFDLEHAAERQQKFLADPANHFEWIEVKGGEFWMGDDEHLDNEKPAHRVKVNSFRMAKHPVTNRLIAQFPFGSQYSGYGGESHPAIGNTWYQAYYFALWIGGRLPTEAEWEYAARGGRHAKRTQYYFGDAAEELANHAWYGESEKPYAHAVHEPNRRTGKENVNQLGLANMLGNVWEWCADWYDGSYYRNSPAANPKGPAHGVYRVLRGGAWYYDAVNLRCARRFWDYPAYRSTNIGFRCAQDVR